MKIKIMAVLAFVIALGGAAVAYEQINDALPWVTKDAYSVDLSALDSRNDSFEQLLGQVAVRSCENQLRFLKTELRAIDRQIADAKAQGNNNWLQSLLDQKSETLREISRLKRECGWN